MKTNKIVYHTPHLFAKILFCTLSLSAVLSFLCCTSAEQHRLQSSVDEYNTLCPLPMSDGVRIDSLVYNQKTSEVIYYCTVEGVTGDIRTDTLLLAAIKVHANKESRKSLDSMRSSDNGRETLLLLESVGANLAFVYQLDDATPVARFSFTKSDWK